MKAWLTKERSPALLFAVAASLALLIFIAPLPVDGQTVGQVRQALTAPSGSTFVVGNSVVDHLSPCDGDRRTLPQMIAALRPGAAVIDGSAGGQDFSTSLGLAATALRWGRSRRVVLPISLETLAISEQRDAHKAAFLRLTAGRFQAFGPASYLPFAVAAPPPRPDFFAPFAFKGRSYPDYNGLKAGYFAQARRSARCPEGAPTDPITTAALYWHGWLAAPLDPSRLADIARLSRLALTRRKTLIVVLMPFAGADLALIDADLSRTLATRSSEIVTRLGEDHVPVLDLFDAVPPSGFADRWCACGHLQASGRLTVARAVAGAGG